MKHYKYKTEPRGKQAEVLERSWAEPVHAFLCRPGTGKSKLNLDTAGALWLQNIIDTLIVVAPEGVDRQWVDEAVPRHLSDDVPRACGNYTSRMGKRAYEQIMNMALLPHKRYLKIATLSFDGLQTARGRAFVRNLQANGRTMLVVDESHRASNPKAAVHKAIVPVARLARIRRIATGTLIRQNPFSAFGQFQLLEKGLLGFQSLAAFKSMYAQMLPPSHPMVYNIAMKNAMRQNRRDHMGKLIVTPITGMQDKDDLGRPIYRNLRDLRTRLERFSSFLTLADVNGTEPVVNEDKRYVTMSDQQRALYNDLVRYGVAHAPMGQLTTEGALALSIRLAQVAGGFAPSDDDPEAAAIPGSNPKVEELLSLLEELEDEKVVIWCRFTAELTYVSAVLRGLYGDDSVSEYHGRLSANEKAESKHAFINLQHRRFFVGQVKAGGTGLDGLQAVARYMIFYSNEYPYLDRLQAISRLARTDGFPVVQVYDLVGQHTIDEDVVNTLRAAQDVSEAVLLRAIVREWE